MRNRAARFGLTKWKCVFLRHGLVGCTPTGSMAGVAESVSIGECTVKCVQPNCWSCWNIQFLALDVVAAPLFLILSGCELLGVCLFVFLFALCNERRLTELNAGRTVTKWWQAWNHFCRCTSNSLHISDFANKNALFLAKNYIHL
jgi:hypothetical protein